MNDRFLLSCLMVMIFAYESNGQYKIEFQYPDDIVVDSAKKIFEKQFKQGHILYDISCAGCHTVTEGKKQIIPDFSLPQLMDYEMRIYPEHAEELPDTRITDVELTKIITFLRYKKKSGKTIRPPASL